MIEITGSATITGSAALAFGGGGGGVNPNGKFVVTGESDRVLASTDAITWSEYTMPTYQHWSSIAYGNGKFATPGEYGTDVAVSTDATTWTLNTFPTLHYWKSIAYGNGKFVVPGAYSTDVAVSTDATTWTLGTMPSLSLIHI